MLVVGSYGSCSHCDAFESEFGYDSCLVWDDEAEDYIETERSKEDYNQRLSDFGKRYLHNPYTKEMVEMRYESLKKTADDDWFDMEDLELYEWAMSHFQ